MIDTQLDIPLADPNENDLDPALLEQILTACRAVAKTLTYEHCAAELDAIWGERGRPVSASTLRAAMSGTERNYFRIEWAFWFARQSDAVGELLLEIVGRGRPKKKAEDELRDLKALVRESYPKHAAALIRKAELP